MIATLFISQTALNAQTEAENASNATETTSYVIGGTPFLLPAPPNGMVAVGPKMRQALERAFKRPLLAAFAIPEQMKSGNYDTGFLVGAVPASESKDISLSEFTEIADYTAGIFYRAENRGMKNEKKRFKSEMKAQGVKHAKGKFHKPRLVGVLYSRKDGIGLGAIMWKKENGATTRWIDETVLLRVKKHILMLTLGLPYTGAGSVQKARVITQQWADAILDANE